MRPSTYSIVACDPERRELGVAVQSKFLAVGLARALGGGRVGAVATQAWMNPDFGPDGLALLRDGLDAEAALERLVAGDSGRDRRQVGIVDASGRAATYTGSGCLDWAGSRTGGGYAVQGNILVSEATVDAMASAFEPATGSPLAERLLAALARRPGCRRRPARAAGRRAPRRREGSRLRLLRPRRRPPRRRPRAAVDELARLLALHELYFGETPADEWIAVTGALARGAPRRAGPARLRDRRPRSRPRRVGRLREPRGARAAAPPGSTRSCSASSDERPQADQRSRRRR